jgi:hypothetical protein
MHCAGVKVEGLSGWKSIEHAVYDLKREGAHKLLMELSRTIHFHAETASFSPLRFIFYSC